MELLIIAGMEKRMKLMYAIVMAHQSKKKQMAVMNSGQLMAHNIELISMAIPVSKNIMKK